MNRLIRTQLIVFIVIAAVGVVYVGGNYVRLPSLFGIGQYKVYVDLPDTGGSSPMRRSTTVAPRSDAWAR